MSWNDAFKFRSWRISCKLYPYFVGLYASIFNFGWYASYCAIYNLELFLGSIVK